MATQTHYCRCCNGERENNGKYCGGCGTELSKCSVEKKREKAPRCPKCRNGSGRETEPGRYCCRNCQAVYEAVDFGFVDDRPDVNVEKKEQLEMARKRGMRR